MTRLSRSRRRVLELLYQRRYPAAIAEELGVSRQAVHKHVKALLEAGLIREDHIETDFFRRTLGGPTPLKIYGLTEEGVAALNEAVVNRGLIPDSRGREGSVNQTALHHRLPPEPRVEVHNFEVKVPVAKLGISWLPSAADMQNWQRRWDPDFHGVYLEVTTRHILLKAAAEGPDRATAEALCLRRVMRVLDLLERHYGCELGRPEFRCIYAPGRTKIGVVGHPLTEGSGYQRGELATIDSTPEPGTIHPNDPRDADTLVRWARNDAETNELLRGLVEQQTAFFRGLSQLLTREPPEPPSGRQEGMEVA